nr:protein ACCELERATED CELL DEATH 6-like [Ziziphus jujuba var. spinosa]
MDSSSLHEAQQKDGEVFQPKEYQKTKDEMVEAEETGDETLQKTETITNMGHELYWDAARGHIDTVLKSKDHLQSLLTPNKNTILHIYITSRATEDQGPSEFVERILATCPALLMQPNSKNDTPLHIAARYGHASIVGTLIQYAKDNNERGVEAARQMMRLRNRNEDTAFHEAVRFNYPSVVERLVEIEECNFVYSANKEHETPLYMAAERGYREIMLKILKKFKSPATGGPNGRNILHVATIHKDKDMIKNILEKMGALMLKEADENGLTPLHHAAYIGYLPAVKLFLQYPIGREAVYMKSKIGNTALHLAAHSNHKETMLEIIKRCLGCCELVNDKGWNILHSAVHSRDTTGLAMGSILKMKALSSLLNEKDNEGNTPLHYIANAVNIQRAALIDHPQVDKMAFNKQNQNALDLASTAQAFVQRKNSFKKRLQNHGLRLGIRINTRSNNEEENSTLHELEDLQNTNLIVAALIATVTFTAGFTVPGGFFSEKGPLQGTPILGKSPAFKTFIIMDTLAMALSSSAVFIHIFLRFRDEVSRLYLYFLTAFVLTTWAMVAMVVAFVTGTYAMLGYSRSLSIVTCVIGLSFFIVFYQLFKKSFGS